MDDNNIIGTDKRKQEFIDGYIKLKNKYEEVKDQCNRVEVYILKNNNHSINDSDPLYNIMRQQQKAMGELLHILELRAYIENIPLSYKILYQEVEE